MGSVFVQLSGIFCGVLARTLFPFLRKLSQGKVKRFKKRYAYQAIGAFFVSLIVSLIVFPQYPLRTTGSIDWVGVLKLFCVAFAFGFGFNALVNERGAWKKDEKEA